MNHSWHTIVGGLSRFGGINVRDGSRVERTKHVSVRTDSTTNFLTRLKLLDLSLHEKSTPLSKIIQKPQVRGKWRTIPESDISWVVAEEGRRGGTRGYVTRKAWRFTPCQDQDSLVSVWTRHERLLRRLPRHKLNDLQDLDEVI